MKCFGCGQDGHVAVDCQWTGETGGSSRPVWCGECDPQTRLIDHGSYVQRCPRCHPLSYRRLPQHKMCGGCSRLVYEWDTMPCGQHQPLGIDSHGHRPAAA